MVIAHEMAHMWFGDLVTLRWWDDIWLNESFAEYMGYQTLAEATRFTDTWIDFAVGRKGWGYDADQRPSTHPVAPEPRSVPDTASALLNFDGISYAKGASALRQLVAWLGEKDFLAGINTHFDAPPFRQRHPRRLHRLPGRPPPTATSTPGPSAGCAPPASTRFRLASRRAAVSGRWRCGTSGSRPHRVALGLYDVAPAEPSRLVLRERLERDLAEEAEESVVVAEGPRPDLLLVNDGDLTYAKVRLDPGSWETVRGGLSGIPDALSRAVVWNAARDMVRDGELAPGEFLEAVRAHCVREPDVGVLESVLTFARGTVVDRFLPAERRVGALELLSGVCREVLSGPVPAGGDAAGLRLTAVRQFIDCATAPEELLGWWSAGEVPEGPVLDAELKWRLLLRLSVLGAVGTAEIDAALAADPGAAGEEGAARCRAALPDAGAKEAAWEAMFASDALSNYLLRATAQGFWQAEQLGLLEGFVERYFVDSVPVAARRGAAVAAIVGRFAFPRPVVDESVLRLGAECVSGEGVTPTLRRELADQLDDLERAVRVRGLWST